MSITHADAVAIAADVEAAPCALLTLSNPKTAKGEGYGYLTAILHLAPARIAGFEVCPGRTEGCTAACLNTAGRGGIFEGIHRARVRRTKWFRADRPAFMLALEREIAAHVRRAARHGLAPAVRLNGTSDIPWENVRYRGAGGFHGTIFERFPDVQFYDYTKVATRFARQLPGNYDLTFSAADENDRAVDVALKHGARVAVVFRNTARPFARKWDLPATWNGRPVIDADAHDLRFTEPAGVICGLRAKGAARTDRSGFVRDLEVLS